MSAFVYSPQEEGKEVDRKQPGLEYYNDQDTNKVAYGGVSYPTRNPYGERVRRSGNPFGLSPLLFGLLVAALAAIIVGAAVGGGLAGTLGSCRSQNSLLSEQASNNNGHATSTSTAVTGTSSPDTTSTGSSSSPSQSSTSTGSLVSNYSVTNPSYVNSLFLNCPTISGQGLSTFAPPGFRQNWTYNCGVDYKDGLAADGGGTIRDIAVIVAYSVDDCVQSCFGLNVASINSDTILKCSAVFFTVDLRSSVTNGTGNCFLKNATIDANTDPVTDDTGVSVSLDPGF